MSQKQERLGNIGEGGQKVKAVVREKKQKH